METADQGDADAHAAAVDRLIAAILARHCLDAKNTSVKPCDQRRARGAIMWLNEYGCEYMEYLGWGEQDLTDYLSGARQPALRMWEG